MIPSNIVNSDCPLLVFSDHTSGLIGFLIKFRTRGSYNHTMWMIKPGYFCSQGNTYSEVPIERYMKKGNRLKFVFFKWLTPVQKEMICASIKKKLQLPCYKKAYDCVGIIGQVIGIKRININGLNYCSEDVVSHLVPLVEYLDGDLKEAISLIPLHGSPDDLNEYMKRNPFVFKTFILVIR